MIGRQHATDETWLHQRVKAEATADQSLLQPDLTSEAQGGVGTVAVQDSHQTCRNLTIGRV